MDDLALALLPGPVIGLVEGPDGSDGYPSSVICLSACALVRLSVIRALDVSHLTLQEVWPGRDGRLAWANLLRLEGV